MLTVIESLLEVLSGVFPVACLVVSEALIPYQEESVVEVFADDQNVPRFLIESVDRPLS